MSALNWFRACLGPLRATLSSRSPASQELHQVFVRPLFLSELLPSEGSKAALAPWSAGRAADAVIWCELPLTLRSPWRHSPVIAIVFPDNPASPSGSSDQARNLARLRDHVDVAKPRMCDGLRDPQCFYLRIGERVLDVIDGAAGEAWMPDDVVFVEALSYAATGRIQKMELRRRFAGHYSPVARSTA